MAIKALLMLLLLCGPVSAAVTIQSRGTGGNGTGAGTLTITPGSDLAAGSMGVIVLALDNSGAAGSNTTCNASMVDSVGNTWTERLDVVFDNGAASAGAELCIYTGALTTAFTTADNVVVGFGTSPAAKSWALLEVVPTSALFVMSFVDGAGGTGATSGTPTVTTSSITSGNVVIGGGSSESTLTWTGDADTSNGSWTNEQERGQGTGTTGIAVTSQAKVVTGTATQTYNPTQTSADQIIGWIQLAEVAAPSGMGKRIIWM